MVDALSEARRVLTPRGVLIDVRPVIAPMTAELVTTDLAILVKEIDACSTPEDVVAADAAVRQAVSSKWFSFEQSRSFVLEIYTDTAEDLRLYAQTRKLQEALIPYRELEERRLELARGGQPVRLRCRRPWMLSTYRKK